MVLLQKKSPEIETEQSPVVFNSNTRFPFHTRDVGVVSPVSALRCRCVQLYQTDE